MFKGVQRLFSYSTQQHFKKQGQEIENRDINTVKIPIYNR